METAHASLSRLACLACRRQKRKCTRELPSCHLCQANHRRCSYPPDGAAQPYQTPEYSPTPLPHETPAPNAFPPLFFLDSEIFTKLRSTADVGEPILPPELRKLASHDDDSLLQIAEQYFQSTHRVFPFVSKRRFIQQFPSKGRNADFLLLILCMGAVSQPKAPAAYERAKSCISALEMQGSISIKLLQSSVLLGVYEMSHAIFPAAFLTVGHCARLGQVIGLHDRRNAAQLLPSPHSWVELEELRRTWWAVFVLDRFVSVGIENRPFASDDVKPEELLPMNDGSWDRGEQTVSASLAVTSDTSLGASTFARTCQASHLLSRVLSHINSNAVTEDPKAYYLQALQLHKIVSPFHKFLTEEAMSHNSLDLASQSSALGICSSALIVLYYTHSCAEFDDVAGQGTTEQLSMQTISLDGLHQLAPAICGFAAKLAPLLQSNVPGVVADPFLAQCFYEMAKLCIWFANESDSFQYISYVGVLKGALQAIGQRLPVASEYLVILENDVTKLCT